MGIVEELFEKKNKRTQNYGSASTPASLGNDQAQLPAVASTGNTGIVEQLFAKKNKNFASSVGTTQAVAPSTVQPTIKNDALSVEAARAQFDAAKKAEEDAWAAYNQYNNSTHWSTVDMDKMDALSTDIMTAQKAREEAEQKLLTMKYGAKYAEKYGVGSGLQGVDKGVISIGKSIGATPGVIAQTGKAAYEEGTAENADPEVLAAREKEAAAQRAADSFVAMNSGSMDMPEKQAELKKLNEALATATAERKAAESKHAVKLDMTTKPMQNMLTAGFLAEDATSNLSGVSKDVAGAALSVGQNLPFVAAGFIPAVGPALALGGMSAVAGAQDMAQQGAAGKSAGEAFQHGTAVAAIEAMTEKIPLDNLADMVKKGGKSFIVNLFKQAGIEAAEEGVSYTMNYILDKAEGAPDAKFDWDEFFGSVKQGGLSGMFFGLGGSFIGGTNTQTSENTEKRPTTPTNWVLPTTAIVEQKTAPEAVNGAETTPFVLPTRTTEPSKFNIDNARSYEYNVTANGGVANGNQLHGTSGEGVQPGRDGSTTDLKVALGGEPGSGDLRGSGVFLLSKKSKDTLVERGVVPVEYNNSMGNAAFSFALEEARSGDPQNGWAVSPQDAADLDQYGTKTYLSSNGSSGFGIATNGDIVGVFSNKAKGAPKGVTKSLLPQAIAAGGNRLDCYGNKLVDIYSQFGFIPVARTTFNPEYANDGWTPDKGTPDIYFMMHNGESADSIVQNYGNYHIWTQSELDALPVMDYDDAYAYRDGLLAKQSGDTESVGAAPSGFDPYSNMIAEYGIIPEGENPARMVDLPKSTNGEDRVSYSARTVMEAQATPEAMLGDIANAVLSGELSHEVNTDAAAMERARNTVTDKGWEGAKETFHQMARKGVVSKDAVALGQVLLNNAMNSGDAAATIDILTDYASMSTTAAQSLQAQRMLKKLTPEGQLYGIQRSVKNLQEELVERYKDKAPDLEIPENLVQNFLDAQDQDARDAATVEIYKNIASQVPSTWADKWNAWRYMSMLTNPRTHVRNIVGNLGFAPVRMVKNAIATTIETAADFVLPGGIQRTKAALNIASAEDRALIAAAFKDVANVKGQLEGSGKYSENTSGQIDDYRRIFKNPLLEVVRKGNTAAMTAEDTLFSAPAYAGALAGYLKANGVSAQSVTEGTVDGSVLDAARSYAVKEAQKATYRDQNAFSDFIAKANYKGDNPVGIAFSTLAEGVLPFRRTPANILARGIEYSPIGFLSAVSPIDIKIGRVRLAGDLAKLRKGEMTAAEVIDDASAGLTGIGLLALGVYLASQGLVSGGSSGDEEKDAMADLTGGQNYAVSVDGKNYTLDWLAPEALPFFVGVEAYNTLSDNSEEGVTLDAALSALQRITDPMLEMSMLQGVQDLIETVQYAEGSTLPKMMANAAISYLTQAIPTLFGQIERTTEGERATTFVDRTSGIPRDIQYTIGKAANKLPGEFQQIPYIDAWGRTESSGTTGERAFNNFLNPSYTSVENETKADKEINRLLDAGYTGVAPDRVSQSQKVDGEYMNSEQYVEYATTKGQTSYDIVSDMIASDFYKGLTDEEKANVLSLAYTYAGHLAAEEITNGKHESEKYVELAQQAQKDLGLSEAEYLMYYKMYGGTTMNSDSLRDAYDAGIGIETFIDYKEATSGLTADKDKDGKTISGSKKAKVIAEINELNIPSDAKDYLYLSAGYSEKELNNTPWH